VQKDKANQRQTELVRGCLAPHLAHGIDLLKQNEYSQNKGNSRVAIFHKGELRVTLRKYTDMKRDLKLISPTLVIKTNFNLSFKFVFCVVVTVTI
jgi:hypothetical protein